MIVLTIQQIRQAFFDDGFSMATAEPMDDAYVLPSKPWLRDVLPAFAVEMFAKLKAAKYKPGRNDCDDFSDRLDAFVKQAHLFTDKTPHAILWGRLTYFQTAANDWHRVNCTIVREDARPLEVLIVEPQQQALGFHGITKLSPREKESCRNFTF